MRVCARVSTGVREIKVVRSPGLKVTEGYELLQLSAGKQLESSEKLEDS